MMPNIYGSKLWWNGYGNVHSPLVEADAFTTSHRECYFKEFKKKFFNP